MALGVCAPVLTLEQVRRMMVVGGRGCAPISSPQLCGTLAFAEAYQRLGHCRWRWLSEDFPNESFGEGWLGRGKHVLATFHLRWHKVYRSVPDPLITGVGF
jgi:hypothetical protein